MSLNSLPDEIIAKITKKMPHSDRLNLMKTSKRNGRIGEKYRLQYKYGNNLTLSIWNNLQREKSPLTDGNTVRLLVRKENVIIEEIEASLEDISQILKQFPSLKRLTLVVMRIDSVLVREIGKYKGKIALLDISGSCFDLTTTEFRKLTACCEQLHIEDIRWTPSPTEEKDKNDRFTEKDLLSDEGIENIISKLYAFMPYFAPACLRGKDLAVDGSLLTDRLLLEIIPKYWPYVIALHYCVTSFTLDGVIAFVEMAYPKRSEIPFYNLGALVVVDKEDAVRKLTEMANELNYDLEVSDDDHHILDASFKQSRVRVYKPQELVNTGIILLTILYKL